MEDRGVLGLKRAGCQTVRRAKIASAARDAVHSHARCAWQRPPSPASLHRARDNIQLAPARAGSIAAARVHAARRAARSPPVAALTAPTTRRRPPLRHCPLRRGWCLASEAASSPLLPQARPRQPSFARAAPRNLRKRHLSRLQPISMRQSSLRTPSVRGGWSRRTGVGPRSHGCFLCNVECSRRSWRPVCHCDCEPDKHTTADPALRRYTREAALPTAFSTPLSAA